MMPSKLSEQFHVCPDSWLGLRLDGNEHNQVYSMREALKFECKAGKGESPQPDLQNALKEELQLIDQMPAGGLVLRGDVIEAAWSSEFHVDKRPSVDILSSGADDLLLVECKYRAMPETQIVKTIEAFRSNVSRKFDATMSFLTEQGVHGTADVRVVLFNAGSIDKVLNMFNRLRLEDEYSELSAYRLMDTNDFGKSYADRFSCGLRSAVGSDPIVPILKK